MEKGVPIRAICRAISVLQAVNRMGPLTMMEIAKAAGVPYPTAFRLVQTLIYEGMIDLDPNLKRYKPTALVQSLSCGFQDSELLVEVARPHIISLTRRIGWPISISSRVGHNMILRDSTHANTSLTFERYYPGFTLPILDSASGRLCLAFTPKEERDALLRWLRVSKLVDSEYLKGTSDALNLDQIKEQGYAVQGRNLHNLTPGKTASIAIPIFKDDEFLAAITVVFFISSMSVDAALSRYLDEMRYVSLKISEVFQEN
ncbi:MAG: IclR family transcriptional regulator domain-containing protein [Niveispirillum sp.]|uniref:IclR family transcriptional regulator domain-containing protein n=1 Tax=Niveispirillum sp. TaxID=1917217 RepID=UPI003BA5F4E8